MKARHLFAFLVAIAATTTPPVTARAQATPPPQQQQSLPQRTATYVWDKNTKTGQTLLKASFNYRDLVDANIQAKLANGLTTDIVMRAFVLREGDKTPIALTAHACSVRYDLWDEVYRVKVTTAGQPDQNLAKINVEGVLKTCAQAADLVIADKTLLTGSKPFFVGVLAEVNPVSAAMLAQLRQWVARPAGSTGIGPGDALFGSVLGLFVKQLGTADKTLAFRTQSFTPP